ncbi:MAG TPA: class I SAM-dependent methyltransferase [Sphingobium sp.]|nr:class I SAM-dependent methyltransferase [Sphingobium sp.]
MMFTDPAVATVYAAYEAHAAADRARLAPTDRADIPRDELLLPVGPEVGAFLHALIRGRRPARILELGTSYGYSTLFLADAARQVGARVVTMDLVDYKQAHAREQLTKAGLADVVEFRLGDAVAMIAEETGTFDLVLLDIWKDMYLPCFEAFYPKLADEGVIAADNMIHPVGARASARAYRAAVAAKPDLQTALLPIGQGVELSVRWRADNPKL